MTDDEIKIVVTRYITGCIESDAADCLHEMDEFDDPDLSDEQFGELLTRANAIYRQAEITVTYPEKKT